MAQFNDQTRMRLEGCNHLVQLSRELANGSREPVELVLPDLLAPPPSPSPLTPEGFEKTDVVKVSATGFCLPPNKATWTSSQE